MTIEQALKQAADQLKKDPSEFIAHLMQFTDRELERKLDIVMKQKVMAYDQNKKESFELLTVKESLIGHVRLLKFDEELEKKPKRKPRQKKNKKQQINKFQNIDEPIENEMSIEISEETDKQKYEPEQLSFKF